MSALTPKRKYRDRRTVIVSEQFYEEECARLLERVVALKYRSPTWQQHRKLKESELLRDALVVGLQQLMIEAAYSEYYGGQAGLTAARAARAKAAGMAKEKLAGVSQEVPYDPLRPVRETEATPGVRLDNRGRLQRLAAPVAALAQSFLGPWSTTKR